MFCQLDSSRLIRRSLTRNQVSGLLHLGQCYSPRDRQTDRGVASSSPVGPMAWALDVGAENDTWRILYQDFLHPPGNFVPASCFKRLFFAQQLVKLSVLLVYPTGLVRPVIRVHPGTYSTRHRRSCRRNPKEQGQRGIPGPWSACLSDCLPWSQLRRPVQSLYTGAAIAWATRGSSGNCITSRYHPQPVPVRHAGIC